ncbi:MAG: CBS domain-containing protein, partial [Candidatus Saccharimonadales bacterium]
TVYYLHVKDSLSEVLHAFFVTNHPVFVVINSSEEYVGMISVEDILRQLVGHVPGDDFDQFADPEAVAARHPAVRRRHGGRDEPDANTPDESDAETPVKTDE